MRKIPNHKFASPQTHRPCQKVHDGTDPPSPTHPLSPPSLPSYPIRTPSPLPAPSAPSLRTPPSPNRNLWISLYQRYRIHTCYTHNLDRDTGVLVLGPAGQVNVNGREHTGSADRVGGGEEGNPHILNVGENRYGVHAGVIVWKGKGCSPTEIVKVTMEEFVVGLVTPCVITAQRP